MTARTSSATKDVSSVGPSRSSMDDARMPRGSQPLPPWHNGAAEGVSAVCRKKKPLQLCVVGVRAQRRDADNLPRRGEGHVALMCPTRPRSWHHLHDGHPSADRRPKSEGRSRERGASTRSAGQARKSRPPTQAAARRREGSAPDHLLARSQRVTAWVLARSRSPASNVGWRLWGRH